MSIKRSSSIAPELIKSPRRSTAAPTASPCTPTTARKLGESDERMHLLECLARGADFTAANARAFAWTEAMTLVAEPRPDEVYDERAHPKRAWVLSGGDELLQ